MDTTATFTVPPGVRTVIPTLEVKAPYPAKAFLITVSSPSMTDDEAQHAFHNYTWSDKLHAYYRYLSEQTEAPGISRQSAIHLPDSSTVQGHTVSIAILPWGTHTLRVEEHTGRLALCYTSEFGNSAINPHA